MAGYLRVIAVCLLVQLAGCAYLPPGPLGDAPVGGDSSVHVYLIRGFQDWYSTGIQTLTTELGGKHVDARAYGESQWGALGDALVSGRLPRRRLILVGFSYGADDAITISQRLGTAGHAVDLLVTIDPVTPGAVPSNVKRCVNFYQSNGVWDVFPWLRGVPLQRETGDRQPLFNINLRNHPALLEPNTSHATIAANPHVHAAIIELVRPAAQ